MHNFSNIPRIKEHSLNTTNLFINLTWFNKEGLSL